MRTLALFPDRSSAANDSVACSSTTNVALPELPGNRANVITAAVTVRVQLGQTPIPRSVVAFSGPGSTEIAID